MTARPLYALSQIALLCGLFLLGLTIFVGWPAVLGAICAIAASFGLLNQAHRRRRSERSSGSSDDTKIS